MFLSGLLSSGIASAAMEDPLRLDQKVVPISQTIELDLDADKANYTGHVRIELQVNEKTRSFRFHARDMELNSLSLKGPKGSIKTEHQAGEFGLITVTARKKLKPGTYTLDIDFANNLSTLALGLYRVVLDGSSYTFTQFEAIRAREAFPCWDEPLFKIPYRIILNVPRAHMAISNTPIEEEKLEGDQRRVVFETTKPLPSYLLAMATGPFEMADVPGSSIPTRILTVKGQSGLTAEAAKITPPVLKALEEYFGGPYPYKKLDLLAAPEFMFGGMENPGAIVFKDDAILLDPALATGGQRYRLVNFMAHELAHMWFGNLVTMKWWNDLWLNEAFASWLANKISDQLHPEYRAGNSQVAFGQSAMHADAKLSAEAVRQPRSAKENPLQFMGLSYSKGEAVVGMFEHWIGAETFRKGVLAYLDAHRWGNAEADDLWSALAKVSGHDLEKAMPTFLVQPGVPLVKLELLSDTTIRLSQQRYTLYGQKASEDQLWQIPIVLRYPDGEKIIHQKLLLTEASQTFELESSARPAWIHPNSGERGYYRWQLPPNMLAELSAHPRELMDARERMAFLDHLSALLDGGQLDAGSYARTLIAFSDDDDTDVLTALDKAVFALWYTFVALAPEYAEPYATFVRKTLGPALDRIGLQPTEGEAPMTGQLRSQLVGILGGKGGDTQLVEEARALAERYYNDRYSVDPALAYASLYLSALHGDAALFDRYQKRFESAKDSSEREKYLRTLAFFEDPVLIDRALQYVLDGPLRPQEFQVIPMALGESPRNAGMATRWAIDHFDQITTKIPRPFVAFLPQVANGCSTEVMKDAEAFFSKKAEEYEGMAHELTTIKAEVKRCVDLRTREGENFGRFLHQLKEEGE